MPAKPKPDELSGPIIRGELKVIMLNLGKIAYEIRAGDRIAQLVVAKYEPVEWDEGDLADSSRGVGFRGSALRGVGRRWC